MILKKSKAAMCFHWKTLQRQVRVFGNINQVDSKEADAYFSTRPYGSKIGAWASDQSKVMKERSELLKKIEDFKKNIKMKKMCPDRLIGPDGVLSHLQLNFGYIKKNRIHERLRYNKTANDWKKEILYP